MVEGILLDLLSRAGREQQSQRRKRALCVYLLTVGKQTNFTPPPTSTRSLAAVLVTWNHGCTPTSAFLKTPVRLYQGVEQNPTLSKLFKPSVAQTVVETIKRTVTIGGS